MNALLRVSRLGVRFPAQVRPALDEVSFELASAECVALVGASGSGKSMTALALMGLLPPGAMRSPATRLVFEGALLEDSTSPAWRTLRGHRMAMVFQNPSSALNPGMPIVDQIAEVPWAHGAVSRDDARREARQLLERVGLAAGLAAAYPHELSGGQCQRAMLAMATVMRPALLIADEPTSALDTVTQAHLLRLLDELRREHRTAVLLITHDLGLAARHCTRALVLEEGRLVEDAPIARAFSAPAHEATAALVRAIPRRPAAGASR